MPIFIPDISYLTTVFTTGTLGIADQMFAGIPNFTPPTVTSPGLPNFEKTMVETFSTTLAPVTTVIQAVGGILTAAQSLMESPPTEWIDIIATNIATPVADVISIISTLLPPDSNSIGNLILSPITINLKLPTEQFFFPASNFVPVPDIFPDLSIPIPAFGNSSNPNFPTSDGLPGLPPSIKTLLGIISFPISFIFSVFQPISDILGAITNPTTIGDAVTNLINLPATLIPTPENLIAKIIQAIGIPPDLIGTALPIFTSFIEKIAAGLLNILKAILGLND